METYAGIGSRRAPSDILGLITRIARRLREDGKILRTGHAIGCDQAFEHGAGDRAQVFLPWKDYESDVEIKGQTYPIPCVAALQLVEKFHPRPDRLSMAVTRLHARNCHILLGPALDDPVSRVICFTLDELRGGTSFGLRIAREYDIPVYNLADQGTFSSYWYGIAS